MKLTAIRFTAIVVIFISCNNTPSATNIQQQNAAATAAIIEADSVIIRLRPVLFDLQNAELSFNGRKPFNITISNIRYNVISSKEYYTEQQASLQQQAKFSTNKEKTTKALNYLSQMISSSKDAPEIYKVFFLLNAQVDKTNYDSEKILYLKKDLSLLQLIFPQ